MNVYATESIRNVVLLGHGGCGKTSLIESMAFTTGIIKRVRTVTEGGTVSDYDKEEVKRKFSIQSSVIPLEVDGVKVNLLDTPGFFDFSGEVYEALSVADGAIIVINGKSGVEVGTRKSFEFCAKRGIPVIGTSEGKAYVESVREITGLGTAAGANNRYTGTVDAESSWKINLQSDMSVEKRYVNVGDQVKKGDKLFKYNTQELKLSKEKKELEQETLQNEINQLTKDISSYQSDLKSASATEKIQLQTQILTAQTTIKKDQYTIKTNKETIKTLEKNIKDATVKSKMNGLVKKINSSLESSSSSGDDSSDDGSDSGDGSSDDSTYMTILAVGNYRIKGKVSETNVNSLNEGDPVIVRSRVDDSQTWKGTISSIKTDATADDSTESSDEMAYDDSSDGSTGETASKYNFYVKLDDDNGLMMGQHVLVEPDNGQDEKKDGMWLPAAYIKKSNGKYYVWLDSHNKLKLQEIKVGEYDENLDEYEVKSGLKTTDYIACDDSTLKEGMRVTRVAPEDSTSDYGEEQTSDDAETFGADDYDSYEGDTSDYGEDTYDSGYDESIDDGIDAGDDSFDTESDSSDAVDDGTSDSDIADFGE